MNENKEELIKIRKTYIEWRNEIIDNPIRYYFSPQSKKDLAIIESTLEDLDLDIRRAQMNKDRQGQLNDFLVKLKELCVEYDVNIDSNENQQLCFTVDYTGFMLGGGKDYEAYVYEGLAEFPYNETYTEFRKRILRKKELPTEEFDVCVEMVTDCEKAR